MKLSRKSPWHPLGSKVFVVFSCGHGDYLIQTLTISSYSTVYYFEEHAVPRSPKFVFRTYKQAADKLVELITEIQGAGYFKRLRASNHVL